MNCTIERTEEEIILRFPVDMDFDAIKREIDKLRFLELVGKSQASQEEISQLASEVKKGIGERTRAYLVNEPEFTRFVKSSEEE